MICFETKPIDPRRPCYVDNRKALFHVWTYDQDPTFGCTFGIVEFEDGTVSRVLPDKIKFADGGGFDQTYFCPQK